MADSIDGLGLKSEKPQLNPSVNLGVARLTPTEAFVLSRVDGKTSYEEICSMTGLGPTPPSASCRSCAETSCCCTPGRSPSR